MSDKAKVEDTKRFPAHRMRETGARNALSMLRGNGKGDRHYLEAIEDLLEFVLRTQGEEQAPLFLESL
ncbi:MAG TPA: hypothetical protein VNT99_01360, partial [Methylomirabilota bacterium]|nr:hypothetical protein [Methylomirabilota bacterium]